MKRFHVHVTVKNLEQSVRFYSTLFGADPSVLKSDYAKWMLEDPRLNFAISHRAEAADAAQYGVEHLGLQVETREELEALGAQLKSAEVAVAPELNSTCCYAQSDKGWVHDPQGLAWETFYSFGTATTYSGSEASTGSAACCTPAAAAPTMAMPIKIEAARQASSDKPGTDCCG
jgi:catechol 2,3-dioxygenase-like lactoylglutathione lyase family enzyme